MESIRSRLQPRAGRRSGLRRWLAGRLIAWGTALRERPAAAGAESRAATPSAGPPLPKQDRGVLRAPPQADEHSALAACPALREPLSVEEAVLHRDLTLLKREAADALAALGSAHALVASARLAEVQSLRERLRDGEEDGDRLLSLAGDYQGWQADQVRLFDALALVMRMRVPEGRTLEQVDPGLHAEAKRHLESLSVEYQRMLLGEQMGRGPASN